MDAHPKGRLGGLLVALFFGALNDNAWRVVVVLLAFRGVDARLAGAPEAEIQAAYQQVGTAAMLVFLLPLILFSLPAGVVADRLSKRTVIVWTKAAEVGLMLAALVTLVIAPLSWWPSLVVVGMMGVQSAIFSPAKYGILPEILPHERLSRGNGLVQLWTFVAIVGGVAVAGPLVGWAGDRPWLVAAVLVAFSLIGFAASLWVPRVEAARAEGRLVETVRTAGRVIRGDRVLLFTVVGLVLFWTIGSLLVQNTLVYGRSILALDSTLATLPNAMLSIGVGVGSLLAIKLSGAKVEYGLIPLGAVFLALLVLLQGGLTPDLSGTVAVMSLVGVAGGLIIVPLEALLQWQSPADRRGGIIALANVFASIGTLTGSVLVAGLSVGIPARGVFIAGGVIALAGTAWALSLLPAAFLRLVAIVLTHTFYRLTVLGRGNVPSEGEALLVPNHVSLIDALFILAATDRQVRFVVKEALFQQPILRRLLRIMGAIPISATGGPRMILSAMRTAAAHLDQGKVVCIFPEGEVTRSGMMLPFRQGFERMVKGRETPIIPVHLDQVWGSIFSRSGGRFVWKVPRRLPYPVTVSFGQPLPADASVFRVRQAVRELGAEAWALRKSDRQPLHRAFIRSVRRRPRALAFADEGRPRVSRFASLVGAIALARKLRPIWGEARAVGVMLPPSVAGALVNIAVTLSGRTVVNLNYTAGRAGLESAARQAGLESVVTSRVFLDKAAIELPQNLAPIWVEDAAAEITRPARLASALLASLAPSRLIEWYCGARRPTEMDDIVTIIFSSGSTGEPKGVMLSHFNVDANVEAGAQIFHLLPYDRVLGVLPLFHSFGYMVTLWFAANHGLAVVYHPNPLDTVAHGALIERYRITLLATTPTFLQIYMTRNTPGQLGSIRVVLVGAEKLPDRVADAFEARFGIRPLEGYGATECAPIIAVSVPDHRTPGFYQPGARSGFVGRAMPGIALRVVDPDAPAATLDSLPAMTPGMLLVRGCNVMQGYLGRDDLTKEALHRGWYVTGDIALIDHDGFVRITDRLSRFSKIGGEMVPHGRVEEALHHAAGVERQIFAVTAVPDDKKGERLAVLHTSDPAEIPHLLAKVKESGLPNLFIPRPESFLRVEELPTLGTGKIDLRALKRIASQALGAR